MRSFAYPSILRGARTVMSEHDAFDRVLAAVHDATLDETRWPATSALIDEACGLTGNGLMVAEGPTNDVRALFVGLYYRGQRRDDLEREYLTTYHPLDERVPRFRQLPARRLAHHRPVHGRGVEDLTDLQRAPAQGRDAGRPERPAPRAGRLPHRLGPERSRRRGGLGVVPDHEDRAAAAPYPAVRPRPAGAGGRRRPGRVARRPARHHRAGHHPAGRARADRGGERPGPGPAAHRRGPGRQRRGPGRGRGTCASSRWGSPGWCCCSW